MESLLLRVGIFRKYPWPPEVRDPEVQRCAILWRAVLDLAMLELIRGPDSPYPDSPPHVKETKLNYRAWIHWVFASQQDGDNSVSSRSETLDTGAFAEVCSLGYIDPAMAKETILRFISAARVIKENENG